MLYPLTFHAIYKERVWGGRNIGRLFGKELPPGLLIGESWEISDRPGDATVVANGPLAGKDLHWLMEHFRADLLGVAATVEGRFPLLVKILDAQQRLSLQVHPPADVAKELNGEPKTEMWYVVDAKPGAELLVGLKQGVTREGFVHRIRQGLVETCVHHITVRRGDAMFLPGGRVHAIGAGNVIFEIQQNSDTTYRVHDWNRVDEKGRGRELHIRESLASIDFNDFEPKLIRAGPASSRDNPRILVDDVLFQVTERFLTPGSRTEKVGERPILLGVMSGCLEVEAGGIRTELTAGGFCLVPASLSALDLECAVNVQLLWAAPR